MRHSLATITETAMKKNNTEPCHLWLLPHELFVFSLKHFLFSDDWVNLLNTSLEYFDELKKKARYIALNKNSSRQFLNDPLFRQRILSLVNDPYSQVSCHLEDLGEIGKPYDASLLCNLNRIDISNCRARSFSLFTNVAKLKLLTMDYLQDFNCFAQVKKLLWLGIYYPAKDEDEIPTYDLSSLSPTLESLYLRTNRIANYQFLSNLRYVEFRGCDSITDVSCFRNAIRVKFRSCSNVINVNSLANVEVLVLDDCNSVTDVSALGNVETMEIGYCENLNDISALSTVHNLTIYSFEEELLAPLNQNTILDLSEHSCDLNSIQFLATNSLLCVLDISGNDYIDDISMLHTVKVLYIKDCMNICSLTGLTALKELDMRGVDLIDSGFKVFQQLTRLKIGKVSPKKRIVRALEKAVNLTYLTLEHSNLPINTLVQVKDLTLEYCKHIAEFPATLIHLKSLKIKGSRITSFPAFLPSLLELILDGLHKLLLLQIFGECNTPALNNVKISCCGILSEIQITRRINKLSIEACPDLDEISGKEFVVSLVDQLRFESCILISFRK
jgi:hypothetical protein